MNTNKKLVITLIKSLSGRLPSHIACAHGLGLKRRHHQTMVLDTPENRGMIRKISYLIQVEEQE